MLLRSLLSIICLHKFMEYDVDEGTANIIHHLSKRSNFSSLYMLHDDGDDDVDNTNSDDDEDGDELRY